MKEQGLNETEFNWGLYFILIFEVKIYPPLKDPKDCQALKPIYNFDWNEESESEFEDFWSEEPNSDLENFWSEESDSGVNSTDSDEDKDPGLDPDLELKKFLESDFF